MPPFGDEIEEPLKKPLPFLSLSHAQSARPSKPKPVKAFGAEPDEPVSCPVPAVESRRGSGQRGCIPSSASTVFGSEPEESVGHRAPKVRRKDSAKSIIFGEEQEEDDSSSRGVGFPFAPRGSDSDEQLSDHDFLQNHSRYFHWDGIVWPTLSMPPSGKTTLTIQRASQLRESMTIPRGLQMLLITERTMVAFRKKWNWPCSFGDPFQGKHMPVCHVYVLCFPVPFFPMLSNCWDV